MTQTRLGSLIEALFNTCIGLVISVIASTGLSEGRCTAACGVKWSDQ